jgi:hypothetical protein
MPVVQLVRRSCVVAPGSQMLGYRAFQSEPVEFRCRIQRSEWTVGAENSCVEEVEFWVAGERTAKDRAARPPGSD